MTRWVMLILGSLSTASLAAGAPPISLETAARMSPRPASCRTANGAWQRVEHEAQRRQCATLAVAYTLVEVEPIAAREAVEAALSSLGPTSAFEARSLRTQLALVGARSWLETKEPGPALAAFAAVAEKVPVTYWDVASLHDFAISSALTQRHAQALELYRRLIPLAAWLSRARQAQLALEAAAASLRVESPLAQEALAYLALVTSSEPDRQSERVAVALGTAARLLLGQAAIPADDVNLLMSNLAAGESAPTVALALTPSDWLLIEAVAAWAETGRAEAWRRLAESETAPGHRHLKQRMLQEPP